MFKYTTPNLKIVFEQPLTDYEQIAITFKKNENVLTIYDGFVLDENTLTLELSQIDTSKLGYGTQIQVNVLFKDGTRSATKIFTVNFNENLLDEVME